jgi:hypothetical protein
VAVRVSLLSNDLLFSDPKDPSDFLRTHLFGQIFKILLAGDLENWMGAKFHFFLVNLRLVAQGL